VRYIGCTVGNFLPTKRIIFRLPCGEIIIEFVGSLITDRYGVHNEERGDLVTNELVNDEGSCRELDTLA